MLLQRGCCEVAPWLPDEKFVSASPQPNTPPDWYGEEVISPCIGVCTLGPGDFCIGCFRSSDEIGDWLSYSPQDRNRIIELLPQRFESLFAP